MDGLDPMIEKAIKDIMLDMSVQLLACGHAVLGKDMGKTEDEVKARFMGVFAAAVLHTLDTEALFAVKGCVNAVLSERGATLKRQ